MLHCARECSKRTSDNFITFGEFCVFATELNKYYSSHDRDPSSVDSLPVQVNNNICLTELIIYSLKTRIKKVESTNYTYYKYKYNKYPAL